MVALSGSFIFGTCGRIILIFPKWKISMRFLDSVNTSCNIVSNILIKFTLLVLKKNIFQRMMQNVEKIDTIIMKIERRAGTVNKSLRLGIVLPHFYYLSMFTISIISLNQNSSFNKQMQYFIFDSIFRYRLSIFVLYLYYLIEDFLNKIMLINRTLENISLFRHYYRNLVCEVQNISKTLITFSQTIILFNNLFGWLILAIFICTAYESLAACNLVLNNDVLPTGRCWLCYISIMFLMTQDLVSIPHKMEI